MAGRLKIALQSLAHRMGYQIRRVDENVSLDDAFSEQMRLAGSDARCIVEVGAADGRDSERYARAAPGARVLAFEPIPESFEALRVRTAALPSITAVNAAVSDRPGQAEFHVGTWLDSSSLLKAQTTGSNYDAYQKPTHSIRVEVVTLDDACRTQNIEHIDLLKMDAQGAELKILAGASELLQRGAIRVVYAEVHFNASYEGSGLFHDISLFLHRHGFGVHNIYNLTHDHTGRLLWGDAIFVHRGGTDAVLDAA